MIRTVLIGATLALASGASAQIAVPAEGEMPRAQEQLDNFAVPREVSPALMPYLVCKQSEQGVTLYDQNGDVLNPTAQGADCAALREKSKMHAISLLEDLNLGRHRGERAAYAERWLTKIDDLSPPDQG